MKCVHKHKAHKHTVDNNEKVGYSERGFWSIDVNKRMFKMTKMIRQKSGNQ